MIRKPIPASAPTNKVKVNKFVVRLIKNGRIYKVKITKVKGYDLQGEVLYED